MNSPVPDFVVVRPVRGTPHAFQVYVLPDRIVFIRLGMGPVIDYAAGASGGLIGGLVHLQCRWEPDGSLVGDGGEEGAGVQVGAVATRMGIGFGTDDLEIGPGEARFGEGGARCRHPDVIGLGRVDKAVKDLHHVGVGRRR